MKLNVNSIFRLCLGASALVLSVAAFNFSVKPAHAAPTPAEFISEGTDKIGKYQITLASAVKGEDIMWTAIIYDTETGSSRTYYEKGGGAFGPSFSISKP
jgi:hypothetical protein